MKLALGKLSLSLLVLAVAGASGALADAPQVDVTVAVDADSKPSDSFAADVPQLTAFFESSGTAKGDKVRGTWIATDTGGAAPANFVIDKAVTVTCAEADCSGSFTVSKPTKGWPHGEYRVEIYWNEKLAATAEFSIGDDAGGDKGDAE